MMVLVTLNREMSRYLKFRKRKERKDNLVKGERFSNGVDTITNHEQ